MTEIDLNMIYAAIGLAQVPTWTLIIWMLKVQRQGCIALAEIKKENEYEHTHKK